jgi:hypothetical protein
MEMWRMAAAQVSAATKSSGRSMSGTKPVSVMNLISAHISVAVFHRPVRTLPTMSSGR